MEALRPFFQGDLDALCVARDGRIVPPGRGEPPKALLPGSFNPVHEGHWRLSSVAERLLGTPVVFELSVRNVDKPPLDMPEVRRRLAAFAGRGTLWLTRAATFVEKARLFPGTVFVLGADTAERLVAARYYADAALGVVNALALLRESGCRFLVAGRTNRAGVFQGLEAIAIPAPFRALFTAIGRDDFQFDISSTELREPRNH